jgi:hypothetical protein
MELEKWWNMDECIDKKGVLSKLKSLKNEGKIEYDLNGDILKIEDIDLDETEVEDLIDLFEENDIFEDLEYGEEDEEDWDGDGWADDSFDDY